VDVDEVRRDLQAGDPELWRRAAGGDGSAFGVLFERHSTAVYQHCFRRSASWSVAEDLTSVVFLEAWRRRKDVVMSGGSVLPWLLAVANNVVRNQARSQRRYRALLARLSPPPVEADPAEDVVERLADEQTMRGVLAEVGRLREGEQEVLALVAWAGLTYADVALVLDIPIGTVRSRLARARERLRSASTDPGVAAMSRGSKPATTMQEES